MILRLTKIHLFCRQFLLKALRNVACLPCCFSVMCRTEGKSFLLKDNGVETEVHV